MSVQDLGASSNFQTTFFHLINSLVESIQLFKVAAAFQFAQVTFTQANGLRRDFNEFVIVDKLDRAFQRQLDRRGQAYGFVGTLARMLVSFLPLSGLTTKSLSRL